MTPYVAPHFEGTAFNCPLCHAYAKQSWDTFIDEINAYWAPLQRSQCDHCDDFSIWHAGHLLYPDSLESPPPNPDLDSEVLEDYQEAASIVAKSPRGAAALLRLCIQKLCVELGEKGRDLNTDIGNLVRRGLPPMIQQSLDIVRVVGNNAVHPGELDIKDDQPTAMKLFELVNLIAQSMITQPKEIKAVYESLPDGARQQIEKRDQQE